MPKFSAWTDVENIFDNLNNLTLILQLEQDFLKLISEAAPESTEESLNYKVLFGTRWPALAKKILVHSKKSKAADVKKFFEDHKNLITAGTHDDLIALLLLPLIIKASKKVKEDAVSRPLTKPEISKCFILQIQNCERLIEDTTEFEAWVTKFGQETYPYVIFLGDLKNVQVQLIINKQRYSFDDPLKAVESCYKSLTAFHAFPFLCDFVWSFIDKAVYELNLRKTSAFVTKLLTDLNKIEI
ncbi:uncharacterized protein LOC122503901 [Leptopilina heterotoma]|uniref:uncharacterized protein LOC122503901 n=1 Tax=Leptopilina heterotoma TaxID=63436 RepID=UPI001CA8DCDD|nr:uncharacterized protein LOC122503901 [Leptopilina heterotoma]